MSEKIALSKDDVYKIAHLARLGIASDDLAQYATELSNTLDLIANMDRVATDNVVPMAHPLNCIQRARTDVITESDNREKLQKLAPKVEAGLYLVPKVIE